MKRPTWTTEKIKIGFEKFFEENGRLPKAHEIDSLPYLPSSRFIQMRLGGLELLRKELGYTDIHFGKGDHRSTIAHEVNTRGRDCERDLEKLLHQHYGEVFVHSEKMLWESKQRVDFYVYSPEGNFAIDIFYPSTIRTLQSNVNIKMKKYNELNVPLYLISANDSIAQDALDLYTISKLNLFTDNIVLLTLDSFIQKMNSQKAYPNPLL